MRRELKSLWFVSMKMSSVEAVARDNEGVCSGGAVPCAAWHRDRPPRGASAAGAARGQAESLLEAATAAGCLSAALFYGVFLLY